MNENWLLPEGVDEVLPPEAARLEELRQAILSLCWRWGYELVIPPLIEYLDSLLSGMGEDLDLQTFKLTDQLTGRTMGVRADITPQVARIDARRLRREGISRLCYLGPVLHTLPDRFSGSRNPLQLGAELFGCDDAAADVEIIMLMLDALRLAGVEDIWLDLGHVGVFRSLVDHLALDSATEAAVFDALQRKALPELERLLDSAAVDAAARAWLVAVCEINGGLDALDAAEAALTGAPAAIGRALADLRHVAGRIRQLAPDINIHIDLAEMRGYRYHTGMVMAAYTDNHGMALAWGGRYDNVGDSWGHARPATGFSIDLKRLAGQGFVALPAASAVLAPAVDDETLDDAVAKLRAAGRRVVRALPGCEVDPQEAGCAAELRLIDGQWLEQAIEER